MPSEDVMISEMGKVSQTKFRPRKDRTQAMGTSSTICRRTMRATLLKLWPMA